MKTHKIQANVGKYIPCMDCMGTDSLRFYSPLFLYVWVVSREGKTLKILNHIQGGPCHYLYKWGSTYNPFKLPTKINGLTGVSYKL